MGLKKKGKSTCISNGILPTNFIVLKTQASLSIHFHSSNKTTNVSFTQQFTLFKIYTRLKKSNKTQASRRKLQ